MYSLGADTWSWYTSWNRKSQPTPTTVNTTGNNETMQRLNTQQLAYLLYNICGRILHTETWVLAADQQRYA